jgi:hypothetical protein
MSSNRRNPLVSRTKPGIFYPFQKHAYVSHQEMIVFTNVRWTTTRSIHRSCVARFTIAFAMGGLCLWEDGECDIV